VLVLRLQGIKPIIMVAKTMQSINICRKHSNVKPKGPEHNAHTKVLISSITNEDCDDFLCWNFSCSKILGYCCNETLHCLLIENSLGSSRMVDIFAE
jgi:hypothetical protein